MNDSPNTSDSEHPDTGFAPIAMWLLPDALVGSNVVTSVSTKCTPCDSVQFHQVLKIMPLPTAENPVDPIGAMEKARRLIVCTNCGNLSLKK